MLKLLHPFYLISFFELSFGGKSSSSSASTSNTTNIDKRLVVDNGAIGISADSSNVNVNVLDGNAINQAFDFAGDAGIAALDFANKSLSQMIALAVDRDKVTTAAAQAVTDSAMQSINEIGTSSAAAVAAAKEETTGTAKSYQNLLIVGAVAAAGVWGLNK